MGAGAPGARGWFPLIATGPGAPFSPFPRRFFRGHGASLGATSPGDPCSPPAPGQGAWRLPGGGAKVFLAPPPPRGNGRDPPAPLSGGRGEEGASPPLPPPGRLGGPEGPQSSGVPAQARGPSTRGFHRRRLGRCATPRRARGPARGGPPNRPLLTWPKDCRPQRGGRGSQGALV